MNDLDSTLFKQWRQKFRESSDDPTAMLLSDDDLRKLYETSYGQIAAKVREIVEKTNQTVFARVIKTVQQRADEAAETQAELLETEILGALETDTKAAFRERAGTFLEAAAEALKKKMVGLCQAAAKRAEQRAETAFSARLEAAYEQANEAIADMIATQVTEGLLQRTRPQARRAAAAVLKQLPSNTIERAKQAVRRSYEPDGRALGSSAAERSMLRLPSGKGKKLFGDPWIDFAEVADGVLVRSAEGKLHHVANDGKRNLISSTPVARWWPYPGGVILTQHKKEKNTDENFETYPGIFTSQGNKLEDPAKKAPCKDVYPDLLTVHPVYGLVWMAKKSGALEGTACLWFGQYAGVSLEYVPPISISSHPRGVIVNARAVYGNDAYRRRDELERFNKARLDEHREAKEQWNNQRLRCVKDGCSIAEITMTIGHKPLPPTPVHATPTSDPSEQWLLFCPNGDLMAGNPAEVITTPWYKNRDGDIVAVYGEGIFLEPR